MRPAFSIRSHWLHSITLLWGLAMNLLAGPLTDRLTVAAEWQTVTLWQDASQRGYLVELSINSQKAWFLINTGATATALSEKGAKTLGLLPPRATPEATGAEAFPKPTSTLLELKMDGFSLVDGEVAIQPLELLNDPKDWGDHEVSGVIGSDVLARHRIVLNAHARTLHRPLRNSVFLGEAASAEGLVALDCDRALKVPTISATIEGKPFRLGVDTGARATLLDRAFVETQELKSYAIGQPTEGACGLQVARQAVVPRLQVGPVILNNSGANVSDLSKLPGELQGLLGMDAITTSQMVFDYGTQKLWVRASVIDGAEWGIGGPFRFTKEQLQRRLSTCELVANGTVTDISVGSEMKDQLNKVYRKVSMKYRLRHVIKGSLDPELEIPFAVAVPSDEATPELLWSRVKSGDLSLLFLPKGEQLGPLKSTLLKSNAIRTSQLMAAVAPPGKSKKNSK